MFSAVSYKAECGLVCEDDYIPVALQLRTNHQCGINGWEDTESSDMVCEYNGEYSYLVK